ncbi:hypothetical protein A9R00_02135, partial [Oleispira antarctica]
AANLSALKLQSILVRIEAMVSDNNLVSINELIPEVWQASEELKQCFMQYTSEKNEKKLDAIPALTQTEFCHVLIQLSEKLKRNDFIDQDELMPLNQLVNNMNTQVIVDKELLKLLVEKINIFDNESAVNIIDKIENQQSIGSGVMNDDR